MKKARFTEEKMVLILQEADRTSVAAVAKKYGVSEQTLYNWRKQFGDLAAQAEEVRALSAKVAGDIVEPIKAHMNRSVDEVRKAT